MTHFNKQCVDAGLGMIVPVIHLAMCTQIVTVLHYYRNRC
jgi:hypothetical protein